jgi:hypothetical protein
MTSILYSLLLTNNDTVIGESVVTSSESSIVYLLVKLRISPSQAGATVAKKELSVEETKRLAQATAKEDETFLRIWMPLQRMDMPMHFTGPGPE